MSNAHDVLYPNAARTRSLVLYGEYFKYIDELARSLDGFKVLWREKKWKLFPLTDGELASSNELTLSHVGHGVLYPVVHLCIQFCEFPADGLSLTFSKHTLNVPPCAPRKSIARTVQHHDPRSRSFREEQLRHPMRDTSFNLSTPLGSCSLSVSTACIQEAPCLTFRIASCCGSLMPPLFS